MEIHSVFLRSDRNIYFVTGQTEAATEDGADAATDKAKT